MIVGKIMHSGFLARVLMSWPSGVTTITVRTSGFWELCLRESIPRILFIEGPRKEIH